MKPGQLPQQYYSKYLLFLDILNILSSAKEVFVFNLLVVTIVETVTLWPASGASTLNLNDEVDF